MASFQKLLCFASHVLIISICTCSSAAPAVDVMKRIGTPQNSRCVYVHRIETRTQGIFNSNSRYFGSGGGGGVEGGEENRRDGRKRKTGRGRDVDISNFSRENLPHHPAG